jgi:hypothetical protein
MFHRPHDSRGRTRRIFRKKGIPLRCGHILEGVLSSSGLQRRMQEQKILDSWAQAVGKPVAERTRPLRVRSGVLEVVVDSSVWMQQLQFMKGLILQNLSRDLGAAPVKDIRFCIGELGPPLPETNGKGDPGIPLEALGDGDRERIRLALTGVQDGEMREILSRLYGKGLVLANRRGNKP